MRAPASPPAAAQILCEQRRNGEGNIRKRKDGRWEGSYTAGYDSVTGKRIIKNVLGKTQAEVKEKLSLSKDNAKYLDVARFDDYTVGSCLNLLSYGSELHLMK